MLVRGERISLTATNRFKSKDCSVSYHNKGVVPVMDYVKYTNPVHWLHGNEHLRRFLANFTIGKRRLLIGKRKLTVLEFPGEAGENSQFFTSK